MAYNDHIKFGKAINNLGGAEYTYRGEAPVTEELFNKIEWVTGVAENETSITTTDNPHSHLTWDKVNAEMQQVQTAHNAQDYARKRQAEYPSIRDLVVALYDTEDKTAIDAKRAEIKLKYPKPGA
jgi:hypothetical protein